VGRKEVNKNGGRMSVGTQADILARIKSLLPFRWFPDSTPVLDALLSGPAWALAQIYALIQYARLQTRIATATDGFLDLISFDFFGNTLLRRQQEQDNPFRARILATLLREKATRKGMNDALVNLTGRAPIIFEPSRPADTGGWNRPDRGWSQSVGGWGSQKWRAQVFITAFRPTGAGIPNIVGWNGAGAGWSRPGQNKWSSRTQIIGAVTDADIFALIDQVKPAGVTAWVRIQS
jgi:hypothetical protein